LRFKGLSALRLASSIAVLGFTISAADKPTFQAKPIDQYTNKQTADSVTMAAETFTTDDQARAAFGKLNPWRYNILPVLVVLRNDSPNAIRLERMHFEYELPDHSKVNATPAPEVKYARGPSEPSLHVGLSGPKVSQGKNPLNVPEIEIRAFAAKMLPAGDTASGFVYFNTDVASAGASLYVTGMENASTGKELYYFEIPLSGK
jgi:hypothetical protein